MRALREPLLHFLLLGALLFFAERVIRGDERTIEVTNAVRADVVRRFRDDTGRPPTAAEERARLEQWKRDEALFREALREGLDRGDPTLRRVLIDKVRARAVLEVPDRQPSSRELEDWLTKNRSSYETPLRFAVEWLVFEGARAAAERERYRAELEAGVEPRKLGAPLFGASLTVEELRARLGDQVAAEAPGWRAGNWESAAGPAGLLLVRVNRVAGGLPPREELEPRLRLDWSSARRRAEAEKKLDEVARRYRFEETR